ncbi:MAG: hypothetical protein HY889_05365 [Deltaproteobacteria bacterium]|nr:hypothetical protein [Deltaproteobacteria bacterium]
MKKLLSLTIALLLITAYGCAHPGKTVANKLYPDRDEQGLAGYHNDDGTGVLENRSYRISVKHILPGDELDQPDILMDLIKRGYVVLRMKIENRSGKKITFNPVHTALTTDAFDYKKPLEYTDFYELAGDKDDRTRQRKAGAMKGLFYDLTLTLLPGGKTSKLLIFPPLSNNVNKADLLVKDLYVGTDTEELYFPFVARAQ